MGKEEIRHLAAGALPVATRLKAAGVAFERPNTYGAGTGVTYDPEALKVLWEELAGTAGVHLLLRGGNQMPGKGDIRPRRRRRR